MANWKDLINDVLAYHGESWNDVEANTMTEKEMTKEFDEGYGGTQGCYFTIWTKKSVIFPACYDGSEWAARVSRNPDNQPTTHIGGG